MTTRCYMCNMFAKQDELEKMSKSGSRRRHKRGTGCRKGEKPILTVTEVPQPKQDVVMANSRQEPRVHTGAINGLALALIGAGLVEVRVSA